MYDSRTDLEDLPAALQTLVEAELNAGEKIIWIGRPNARRFALQSLPVVLFAIPWTAFALFWMAGAAGFKIPNFNQGFDLFPLFGIPFVLIGFGMLSTPLWMKRKAKRTAYVLTTERAIVFDGGFRSTTIQSFGPERLNDLQRKQRSDGSGDLIFERKLSSNNDGGQRTTDLGFLAIPNVKEVEELVRKLVKRSQEGAS